ncbi:L,D-transpeptidase [Ktedonospora formicarum]|uniref:L,D-TPase catalytic domain-containing protein n=1 Tax=Ktedonospora formicarum TaxID=2778364 RepID=A0A8J3HVF3_9CHLR|nr:L,D-transpeptidase [Ktedonospora formicarum]GHO44489.1 hypothetical protein KSX_26520 [Ktedonospora formicarum]
MSKRVTHLGLLIVLLASLLSLLSACGSDPRVQQESSQSRNKLNQLVQHAKSIGIPATTLQPVLKQKDALDTSSAPWNPFNAQLVNDYYTNTATRYDQLTLQLQGLISATTERSDNQAQNDLQKLQITIAQQRSKGYPVDTIQKLYEQNVNTMHTAKLPKDFFAVSRQVNDATQTLNMMPTTSDKLKTFKGTIDLMAEGKMDVTTLQSQYKSDQDEMAKATKPGDLQDINKTIEAQYQQAATSFTQAIPYIAKSKVDDLDSKIKQLKGEGVDVSKYEKNLTSARELQQKTKTLDDYKKLSTQIEKDLSAMQKDLVMVQARKLLKSFHNEVNKWGNSHLVAGAYYLNVGYMAQGIGEDLDAELANASTTEEYQTALNDIQNAIFHHKMLEQNYNDKTPSDQVHQTDMQLLNRYQLNNSTAIVVSFTEEALRFYKNGKLIYSFLITSGRQELPALPGLWTVLSRQTDIVFKSPYPKGSPYWYEDTPIKVAIGYHAGGYFLHDSPWRWNYGPGTQFPHTDGSGNESASNGTHGCINMPPEQADWVLANSDWNTSIVIY